MLAFDSLRRLIGKTLWPRTRAATRKRQRVLWCLIAMAVSVKGLDVLNDMRTPPQSLSKEINAKGNMAMVTLQSAVEVRREAERLKLEVRRKAADAIFEYAVGEDKTGQAALSEAQRKAILVTKMKRLKESESTILAMYYPDTLKKSSPLLPQDDTLKALAQQRPNDVLDTIAAIDTAAGKDETSAPPRLPSAQHAWAWPDDLTRKLVDPDSPLNLVYKVSVMGLIATFAIAGLTLLLLLAELTGIKREAPTNLPALNAASAATPGLLWGAAATAGVASIGTALAITTAAAPTDGKSPAPPAKSAAYNMQAFNTSNVLNTGGDSRTDPPKLPPLEVRLKPEMSTLPVEVKVSASFDKTAERLTNSIVKFGDDLRFFTEEQKKIAHQPAQYDLAPLIKQTTALAEGTNALQKNSADAASRFNGLAVQVLSNDCYARHSDALLLGSMLQVASTMETARARIASGDCKLTAQATRPAGTAPAASAGTTLAAAGGAH
jgi:hypothetical protein